MFNKWKEITQDNKVKLILFILGAVLIPVVGYFGKDWFESSSTSPKTLPTSVTITASQGGVIQTNQSGQNVVNIDSSQSIDKVYMILKKNFLLKKINFWF